jgi:hypothetical protein
MYLSFIVLKSLQHFLKLRYSSAYMFLSFIVLKSLQHFPDCHKFCLAMRRPASAGRAQIAAVSKLRNCLNRARGAQGEFIVIFSFSDSNKHRFYIIVPRKIFEIILQKL